MTLADHAYSAADLRDATTAITFAMTSLELWEVPMFLKDWREGADLEPWLEGPSDVLAVQPA